MLKQFLVFLFFTGCLLIIPDDAKAYLDPGTASFITQIVISGLVTAALTIKLFFRHIKKIFLHFFLHNDEKGEQK